MATAAQIEANRRNAQKSTGPRTEAGKQRSRLNALEHGGRAVLPVLPGEEPGAYEARSRAWTLSIKPRNPAEEIVVDRLVSLDLQSKRIDRAQTARITKRIYCGLFRRGRRRSREGARAQPEVVSRRIQVAGRRAGQPAGESAETDDSRRISADSPPVERPSLLLIHLRATGTGCEWLLDKWAALRDLLESEKPWLASDMLRAVRLLGRDPIDAIDVPDVARIYLAGHVLLNAAGQPFQEIIKEFSPLYKQRFEECWHARRYDKIAPEDAAAARQMLLEIIDKATADLTDRADVFREIDEIKTSTAGARLSWDDTAEGEKLRRYELTCKRAWYRMFDLLLKMRAAGSELDFATIPSMNRSAPAFRPGAIDTPALTARKVTTQHSGPAHVPGSKSEPKPAVEKAPNEPNSFARKPQQNGSDGQKAFRVDPPKTQRLAGGRLTAGRLGPHPAYDRLDLGGHAPLLNLAPIFGAKS